MQLRGSKQAVTAGGAVIAMALLAACSSFVVKLVHPFLGRQQRRLAARRPRPPSAARSTPRGSTFQTNFQQAAISGVQVGPAGRHRQLRRRSAPARAAPTCTRNTVLFAGSDSPDPGQGEVQGPRGQDGAVLPGPDRPDRDRLQPVRRHRPEAGRGDPRGASSRARSRPGTTRRSRRSTPASTCRARTITLAVRSDSSGTTQNFSEYLVKAAGSAWTLGSASTITWPTHRARRQAAAAAWPRSSSPPRARSATSTSPPPPRPGLTAASIKNSAGDYVAPSTRGRHRGRVARHPRGRPDLRHGRRAGRDLLPDHLPVVGPGLRAAAERQRRGAAQGLPRLPARRRPEAAHPAQPRAAAVQHRLRGRRAAEQDHLRLVS